MDTMEYEDNSGLQTLYGNTKYQKTNGVVFLNLSYSGSTDSDGYLLDGNGHILYLPEGYRPSESVYFFATSSGNTESAPFLCRLVTSGAILVYKRTSSISYLFGNVCFTV